MACPKTPKLAFKHTFFGSVQTRADLRSNPRRLEVKPAQTWSQTPAGLEPNPRGFDTAERRIY